MFELILAIHTKHLMSLRTDVKLAWKKLRLKNFICQTMVDTSTEAIKYVLHVMQTQPDKVFF